MPNVLKIHFLPELDLPLKKEEGRMTRKEGRKGRERGGERERGREGGWRERGRKEGKEERNSFKE